MEEGLLNFRNSSSRADQKIVKRPTVPGLVRMYGIPLSSKYTNRMLHAAQARVEPPVVIAGGVRFANYVAGQRQKMLDRLLSFEVSRDVV